MVDISFFFLYVLLGMIVICHAAYDKQSQQKCNHREILGATSAMVGQNLLPPGWNRVNLMVKVSENLGATAVAPVAPAVTSLEYVP